MATTVPSTTHSLLVTGHATPGSTVELTLDEDIRTVSIQGWDATGEIEKACYYSRAAQTEGDPIDANRVKVSEGGLLPIVISGQGRRLGGTTLFVASEVSLGKIGLIISVYPD